MAGKRRRTDGKKYWTVAEANAALPLVQAVVRDIMRLAPDLRDRYERLRRLLPSQAGQIDESHWEEVNQLQNQLERYQDQMNEYLSELAQLGVELKDPFTGLLDFRCWMDNREVYLCWRHGEPEVAFWHELDAGFAGRQKIQSMSHV
jgi:hypothetical protein